MMHKEDHEMAPLSAYAVLLLPGNHCLQIDESGLKCYHKDYYIVIT